MEKLKCMDEKVVSPLTSRLSGKKRSFSVQLFMKAKNFRQDYRMIRIKHDVYQI